MICMKKKKYLLTLYQYHIWYHLKLHLWWLAIFSLCLYISLLKKDRSTGIYVRSIRKYLKNYVWYKSNLAQINRDFRKCFRYVKLLCSFFFFFLEQLIYCRFSTYLFNLLHSLVIYDIRSDAGFFLISQKYMTNSPLNLKYLNFFFT